MRMHKPPHPGDFVRTEIVEPLGLTVTAAAKLLSVTRPALSKLLNARSSLSPEMALRIEKAFGPKMDTLLRMQTSYDISRAREREGDSRQAVSSQGGLNYRGDRERGVLMAQHFGSLASEKAILRARLSQSEELPTQVPQFTPTTYPNQVPEDQVGRYRSPESRMCVTAEMEIIEKYIKLKEDPPSFREAGPRADLYFNPKEVRIGIVTPGGIAPGLNTVVHSIVNMHQKVYGMKRKAFGFRAGFRGLAEWRFDALDATKTIEWIHKGGVDLVAGRGPQDVLQMAEQLHDRGIDILYVIGGDGSLTAAHLIAQEVEKKGWKIVVAGIPKTMDNDVLWVWHSFGFDTAVEEAARVINALHDEAKSTERICLLPLFGRDAGFVAAHAALGSGRVDVVLVPEMQFKMKPLLKYIEGKIRDNNYALIVVAEGASPEGYSEENIAEKLRAEGLEPNDRTDPRVNDALRMGRLYLLQREFEEHFKTFNRGRHRVFVMEPRYLIRAIAANSVDQIYCQRLANLAVHNALAGFTDFMLSQWLTEYVLVPLGLVIEGYKSIPPGGIFWTTVITSTGQPSFDD